MNCVTQSALPIALHFWQFSATWSVATPGSRTEIAGGGLGRGEGGGAVDTGARGNNIHRSQVIYILGIAITLSSLLPPAGGC